MLKGKSTQPASRPRAPQRPPRRTGLTCTSCRSPRSPCPWPSSPGVQVCESPGAPVAGDGCGSGLSSQCSREKRVKGCCVPFSTGTWGAVSRLGGSPPPLRPRPGLLCKRAVMGTAAGLPPLVLGRATHVLEGGAPLLFSGCLNPDPPVALAGHSGTLLHYAQWAGPTHLEMRGSLGLPLWVACEWTFHSGPGGGGQVQAGTSVHGFLAMSPIRPPALGSPTKLTTHVADAPAPAHPAPCS